MKKIFFLLYIVLNFYAFSDIPFRIDANKYLELRTSDKSLEIYVDFIKNSKRIDTYVIEGLAPDRAIHSMYHYNINGRDFVFIEFYSGNPGGFHTVNSRNLLVFELLDTRIVLKHDIEVTDIIYSSKAKVYTHNQNYWFFFEESTTSIVLYDEKDFNLTEIKRIKLIDDELK